MIRYALQHTHYLLFIYDQMKNELISNSSKGNNLLLEAIKKGKEICRKSYEKKSVDTEKSYLTLYNNLKEKLNENQVFIFLIF